MRIGTTTIGYIIMFATVIKMSDWLDKVTDLRHHAIAMSAISDKTMFTA